MSALVQRARATGAAAGAADYFYEGWSWENGWIRTKDWGPAFGWRNEEEFEWQEWLEDQRYLGRTEIWARVYRWEPASRRWVTIRSGWV